MKRERERVKEIGNEKGMSIKITSVEHCTKVLVRVIGQGKEIEGIGIGNEIKLSLFSGNMIV